MNDREAISLGNLQGDVEVLRTVVAELAVQSGLKLDRALSRLHDSKPEGSPERVAVGYAINKFRAALGQ
jgi:hypothetical protein